MIDSIIAVVSETLTGMIALGVILGVIAFANIVLGTVYNVGECQKPFEVKKFFLGILKAIVIYVAVCLLASGVSMIPVVAEAIKITDLIDPVVFDAFSVSAIFVLVIGAIAAQGKGAIENLRLLWGSKTSQQKIAASYTVENEAEYKEGE